MFHEAQSLICMHTLSMHGFRSQLSCIAPTHPWDPLYRTRTPHLPAYLLKCRRWRVDYSRSRKPRARAHTTEEESRQCPGCPTYNRDSRLQVLGGYDISGSAAQTSISRFQSLFRKPTQTAMRFDFGYIWKTSRRTRYVAIIRLVEANNGSLRKRVVAVSLLGFTCILFPLSPKQVTIAVKSVGVAEFAPTISSLPILALRRRTPPPTRETRREGQRELSYSERVNAVRLNNLFSRMHGDLPSRIRTRGSRELTEFPQAYESSPVRSLVPGSVPWSSTQILASDGWIQDTAGGAGNDVKSQASPSQLNTR